MFASLGVSLLAVLTCSVATLTWFQVNSQAPSSSIVSGSSDINITNIVGHKIEQKLSSDGTINRSYATVTSKSPESEESTITENVDLEGADHNFDVPSNGIGYYLVLPNSSGNYRFSDADGNYTKFTEYTTGSIAYINTIAIAANTTFRIRSYQMSSNKTQLSDVDVPGVTTIGAASDASVDGYGDVIVPTSGNYKVWFDKTNKKVGLERLSALPLSRFQNIKKTIDYSGIIRVYVNLSWDNIEYVRIGGNSESDNAILTSSDPLKYDTSYKYVRDISSNSTYEKMGLFFKQGSDLWQYRYDGGYVYKDSNGFGPGYSYYIDSIAYVSDTNNPKLFSASPHYISGIADHSENTYMKINGGSYTNKMTYNSSKNEFSYSYTATAGDKLYFKVNSSSISGLTKESDTGNPIFNKNNCTSSGTYVTVTQGGPTTVYLHHNKSVWVDKTYSINVGDTAYACTRVESSSADYDANYEQWKATITTGTGHNKNNSYTGTDNITVVSCGSSRTFSVDADTYNNIYTASGNSKVYLVQNASSSSAFLKFSISDGKPVYSSATLWVDGNKVFTFSDGSSTYDLGTYHSSGTFSGYYSGTYTPASGTNATTLTFYLNGDEIDSTTPYSSDDNNFNNSSKIKYGDGTTSVTIYINASNSVYITPIYTITVTRTSPSSTQTKVANNTATNTYTATGFTLEDQDTISAKLNGASIAGLAYETGLANNNINSSLKIIADATNASITLYSDTSKIWASGLKDAEYYVSKDGGINWTLMTKVVSGDADYDAGSDPQYKAEGISVTANDVLTFRKYLHTSLTYSPAIADSASGRNNVEMVSSNITIRKTTTSNIYLKKPEVNGSSSVWVTGYTMTVYFYNGDPLKSASTDFYLSCSNDNSTWNTAILMTHDLSDSRLMSVEVPVGSYAYMAFHTDSTYGGSSYKTVGISIDLANHANKYFHISNGTANNEGKYEVEYYSNLPTAGGSTTFYVNDTNNTYFNSAPYFYAYNNTAHARMPYQGAYFPGISMTEVVANSLYKITVNASHYDKMIFSGGSSSRQTANLNLSSGINGKVWVATGFSTNVTGDYATVKTYSGSATITVTKPNGSQRSTTAMFNGDRGDSNYFIYERGVEAYHGDTLSVTVANVNASVNGAYNSKTTKFVSDTLNRPYLTDSLAVNIDTNTSDAVTPSARFNFYITMNNELSIVMVPDLGNGFYIMPYSKTDSGGTTYYSNEYAEGFIGALKMQSASNSSATYGSFFADENDQIFVGSYINAVDKTPYTAINYCDGCEQGKNSSGTGVNGVIKFTSAGYYTIEVLGDTVTITKFNFNSHFSLNALDTSLATSQANISSQNTALILEVEFTMAAVNNFAVTPTLEVTNVGGLNGYVGYAFDVETSSLGTPAQIYSTMKAKYDVAGKISTETSIAASYLDNGTVTAGFTVPPNTPTTSHFYAYILIDYYYSASIGNLPAYPNSTLYFYIKTEPTA